MSSEIENPTREPNTRRYIWPGRSSEARIETGWEMRRREKRRESAIDLGRMILCPTSFNPHTEIHFLPIRLSKKVHATCDYCGLSIFLPGIDRDPNKISFYPKIQCAEAIATAIGINWENWGSFKLEARNPATRQCAPELSDTVEALRFRNIEQTLSAGIKRRLARRSTEAVMERYALCPKSLGTFTVPHAMALRRQRQTFMRCEVCEISVQTRGPGWDGENPPLSVDADSLHRILDCLHFSNKSLTNMAYEDYDRSNSKARGIPITEFYCKHFLDPEELELFSRPASAPPFQTWERAR